ncbi:MAG: AraC family transcriptional regulator, partial [Bryobacterales bacterium]|nr:AraC family transcriptional regulator [Bryobacterales bacterium]
MERFVFLFFLRKQSPPFRDKHQTKRSEIEMRVELNVLEPVTEPRMWVQHQPVLMMALRTGSIEVGLRRSEMMRLTFGVGEMCLVPRHVETWVRTDDLHYLYLPVGISDAALAAACDGTRGDVELRRAETLVDARVGALAAAVNA